MRLVVLTSRVTDVVLWRVAGTAAFDTDTAVLCCFYSHRRLL